MAKTGKLYGVGLGPGDPELMTLKALRAIENSDVIAYHQAKDKVSHALTIAQDFIRDDQVKLPLIYPLTRQLPPDSPAYQAEMKQFYDDIAAQIAERLDKGLDVSVIVAGDPLLYSSFLPIYQQLRQAYETILIPGITSPIAAAGAAALPLCQGNESFTILSAFLAPEVLCKRLQEGGAFAILKLSPRNFNKVRACLQTTSQESRAVYIESATLEGQKILALKDVVVENIPYFSLILIGA